MSRIGEKPIEVPGGVKVSVNGTVVEATGPKGSLQVTLPEGIQASLEGDTLSFSRENDTQKPFHGLARSLVANIVEGVNTGYTKELEIQGVGFRAALSGKTLSLSLGFASPVEFPIPDSVTIAVNNNTEVVVSGTDKQQVGEVAARIRAFFPAEPYKGKGIRYKDEQIRRKVGKTVA